MTKQEYAVIDMGTNSLRLMTGWKDESRDRWVLSPKQVETTRLGLHAEQTGRLSEAGMQASFAVLERWRSRLAQVPVCVVATSAVREAKDGKAFLAEVRARFGWHCRAITGWEEASLGFCGVTAELPSQQCVLTVDIGGGSSEVASGMRGDVHWSHSYPVGAVRLQEQREQEGLSLDDLVSRCEKQWLAMPLQAETVIGMGGTITAAAAVELGLTVYDPQQVQGYYIGLEKLTALIQRLDRMGAEERRHVRGLPADRSEIIVPGLVILWSFLCHYGLPGIQASERDLMEGVFYRHSFHDAAWRGGAGAGTK